MCISKLVFSDLYVSYLYFPICIFRLVFVRFAITVIIRFTFSDACFSDSYFPICILQCDLFDMCLTKCCFRVVFSNFYLSIYISPIRIFIFALYNFKFPIYISRFLLYNFHELSFVDLYFQSCLT